MLFLFILFIFFFFFSSRRRHTRWPRDWSSDVCSSDLLLLPGTDPSALTVCAAYGKLGLEFYEGQTITRAGSIPGWVVEHGRPLVVNRAEDVRERFPVSHQRLQRWGMESAAVVPLLTEGRCVGALSLMAEQAEAWSGVPPILLEEIAASIE